MKILWEDCGLDGKCAPHRLCAAVLWEGGANFRRWILLGRRDITGRMSLDAILGPDPSLFTTQISYTEHIRWLWPRWCNALCLAIGATPCGMWPQTESSETVNPNKSFFLWSCFSQLFVTATESWRGEELLELSLTTQGNCKQFNWETVAVAEKRGRETLRASQNPFPQAKERENNASICLL